MQNYLYTLIDGVIFVTGRQKTFNNNGQNKKERQQQDMFQDTKGQLKANRKNTFNNNGQKKKDKGINTSLQNNTQKN
jgi:hypothetical protein